MEGANCPKPALLIFSWHVRTTTSLYSKLSHVHKQSEGAPLIRHPSRGYPRNTCLCKGGPFPHSSLGHTNPTYTTKVNRTQRGSSFSQSSHETFTDGCDVNNKSVGNSDLKYRRGLEKSMGKECWEEEKDCPRCGGDGNRGRGKCHRCGGHGTIIIKHCAVVCTC